MKVAINGTGIAGPTLAWWLQRYGHEAVLFEKAPALRVGGYMIDFWGVGYDVAEKMGIVPALYEKGYIMESLRMVDRRGKKVAGLDVGGFRSLINDRFLSLARSDIAATIYHACQDVDTRFGDSIAGIDQHPDGMVIRSLAGVEDKFDLVVGADGQHSTVRTLAFGPEAEFERPLGYYFAAFSLPHYEHRDELTYVSHTVPKRQVARVSLRDDWTLLFFIFRAELLKMPPTSVTEQRACLRNIFGGMQWEVPEILRQMEEAQDMYFDRVSQIRMNRWTQGRVALIGDAGACLSLLAGEGTGLAMTEAYVLAGELHQAGGEYAAAFRNYEAKLRPFLARKQESALRFGAFFAPKSSFGLYLRDLGIRFASFPILGKAVIGRAMRRALCDDFELPDYTT